MGRVSGTIRKVTLDGLTFDVEADADGQLAGEGGQHKVANTQPQQFDVDGSLAGGN